ncbi:MAG: preprotein translocase subunit SecG [Nitrospinota bacterium]|jgi:preprotein translocase subunit SecG|nr:preprotein translocase subunit SecG [Nitrospinota bacterium]MDP7579979.1 preprotein translocase subunit SecG [Nitrospinota bacterium]HJN03228.1 preprotein translocase subunit SecG [Nitrospinota bacterium]
MTTFLTILHITSGLSLILIVLLQTGKGATMGAAFGGSSQTVFGSGGAGGFLGKLTTGVAILFMVTSLSLATISSKKTTSSIVTEAGPQSEAPGTGENFPTEHKETPVEAR